MRKFSAFCLVVACLAALTMTAQAKQKPVVNFKKLQEFLPQVEIPGYKIGKPQGSTSSALGMSTSEASLRYEKPAGDDTWTIEVEIQDMAGIPFAGLGASMLGATEFENQTENGYEKSVKVQGFPGTEKVETGESKSAEINLTVASRFMIKVSSYGSGEVAILHKLLEGMKLAELAKLAN